MTLVMTPSVAVKPVASFAGGSFDCSAPKPGSWRYGNDAAPLAAMPVSDLSASQAAVIAAASAFFAVAMTRHGDPPMPRNC